MTPICGRNYSLRMASEFQTLSEKISLLAELTQQLRRENADLRLRTVALESENSDMAQRMLEARHKVSALMEKYPAPPDDDEEVAS